jgi:hypothetical protein
VSLVMKIPLLRHIWLRERLGEGLKRIQNEYHNRTNAFLES